MSKRKRTDEDKHKELELAYKREKLEIPEIFADPKYDITFKMLFGNDANKDILISLLNSLLGFEGDKEIVEVEINSNELPVSIFSTEKGQSGITSSVDVLCTNRGKQKVAIEMQGQKTKYFLAREQEYMAKLISSQIKEGEGKLYHEKLLETYIIVIGKDNIFIGNTALRNNKLFEIDVVPMVMQTNQVFPDNKMYWKFFELPKFAESQSYKNINKGSSLKEQWLEFLIDCSKQTEEPDRANIIKKGYEIMKVAKWTPDQQVLYWKQKVTEQDLLETQEEIKQEKFMEGKEIGREEGKIEGEIEGKIDIVKKMIETKMDFALISTITGLSKEYIGSIQENLTLDTHQLYLMLESNHDNVSPEDSIKLAGDEDKLFTQSDE